MTENDLNVKVPKNRNTMFQIYDIGIRNIIEGAIESAILIAYIIVIPFVMRFKIFLITMVFFGVMLINIIGVRNKSLTENLVLWFKYKSHKKILELRSPADEYRKSKNTAINRVLQKTEEFLEDDNIDGDDGNAFRKVIKNTKKFITDFRNAFGI